MKFEVLNESGSCNDNPRINIIFTYLSYYKTGNTVIDAMNDNKQYMERMSIANVLVIISATTRERYWSATTIIEIENMLTSDYDRNVTVWVVSDSCKDIYKQASTSGYDVLFIDNELTDKPESND